MDAPKLTLRPDLDVQRRAIRLMDSMGLIDAGWGFCLANWQKHRRLGRCCGDTRCIQLSQPFAMCNPDEAWKTVKHEIAHALVVQAFNTFRPFGEGPHGATFRAMAQLLDAPSGATRQVAHRAKK